MNKDFQVEIINPPAEVVDLIARNQGHRNSYDCREVHPHHTKLVVAELMIRSRKWVVSIVNVWNPNPPKETTGGGRCQILHLRIEAESVKVSGEHVFRISATVTNGVVTFVSGIHTGYDLGGGESVREKWEKRMKARDPDVWAGIVEQAMAHPCVSNLLEYKKPDGLSDDLYEDKMSR